MKPTKEQIEAAARAIAGVEFHEPDAPMWEAPIAKGISRVDYFKAHAQAALTAALAQQGSGCRNDALNEAVRVCRAVAEKFDTEGHSHYGRDHASAMRDGAKYCARMVEEQKSHTAEQPQPTSEFKRGMERAAEICASRSHEWECGIGSLNHAFHFSYEADCCAKEIRQEAGDL